jgi:hypothetical protein
MEKCRAKDRLYNTITKRCYKSCEQKNKDTHPVTKKCRKRCKSEKIRRAEDFRCVKKTLKIFKPPKKIYGKRPLKTKEQITKALEERKEELIPPPLQKEIQKNFQFLDELMRKGEGKKVSYDGISVSDFITVYFHDKYKQDCPMYPIKTYSSLANERFKENYKLNKKNFTEAEFKEYLLKINKAHYIDWNKDKFLKNLKLCLETGEQLIMVPIRIPEHLNMLIIKVPTREIIRFEPHGTKFKKEAEDNKTNIFLENLTKDINKYLNANRKFTYVNPSQLCPKYNGNLSHYPGFQYMEVKNRNPGKGEGRGFCQLWSWFFAECVINNPEMDVREVYKEAFDALKTNENNFATIIRGYFFSINDELKKMKSTFTLKKVKTKQWDNNNILLEYLNKSRGNVHKKERKTFSGGVKKHQFILPVANPKAEPVQF